MKNNSEASISEMVQLNGPMLIQLKDGKIHIEAYKKEMSIEYNPVDAPNPIKGWVVHRNNEKLYLLTSDIFDVIDQELYLENFKEESIKEYISKLLEASLQFIGKIIETEDKGVLIQSTYNEEKEYVLITIGLLNDARIIFCEIKKEENHVKSSDFSRKNCRKENK